jgi:hypothetical protein
MAGGGDIVVGYAALLAEKRERVLAANPQALQKITGEAPPRQPAPVLQTKPIFDKGRYIPPSITRLIVLVAKHSDISPDAICGAGRVARLVNARFCVGKLAEEFAPRQPANAVDGAMLRGEGCTVWYRARHADRLKLYPDYSALYERCRAELRGREP